MGILKYIFIHPKIAKKAVVLLLIMHQKIYSMLGGLVSIAEGGLHPKHRLMHYHDFFIENIDKNDSVLDIGCGNGALSFDVAKKAKFVKAIDNCKTSIEICKVKYSRNNIEYITGDITKDFPKEAFDVTILSNVLEHIDNREGFLNKIGGISNKLLIRVPMINRDWVTLYKKELGLPYKLDPTHRIEYTMDSLKSELKMCGFIIKNCSVQFGEIWAVCTKL